jgi:drug/metabolite transporter (DMT)-like permease
MPATHPRLAVLLAAAVVLFWGTAATAFELALRHVTPYQLLVWSSAVSLLVLALIQARRGGLAALGRMPRIAVLRAALLGVLNPFLYYLVLFAAYDRLPGQIAMALNYGWPLVLALLAVPVLGQPLSRRQLAAIAVSFAGAVLIVTGGQLGFRGGLDPVGVALALGSTVIWAGFWLVNARDGADPVAKLLLGFCVGVTLAVLSAPLLGQGGWAALAWPPAAAWPALAYVGVFEMGLTFVLWLTALQWTDSAARLGHLVYLAPFLSLLFLHWIIGEPIQPTTPLGLALIVGSILWQGLRPGSSGCGSSGRRRSGPGL